MTKHSDVGVRLNEHYCAELLDPPFFIARDGPQTVCGEAAMDGETVPEQERKIDKPSAIEPPVESSSRSCWTWWNRYGLSIILFILLLAVIAVLIVELILRKSKTTRDN